MRIIAENEDKLNYLQTVLNEAIKKKEKIMSEQLDKCK